MTNPHLKKTYSFESQFKTFQKIRTYILTVEKKFPIFSTKFDRVRKKGTPKTQKNCEELFLGFQDFQGYF